MGVSIVALYTLQALLNVSFCIYLVFQCFQGKMRFGKKISVLLAGGFIAFSVVLIELFLERTAPFPQYSAVVAVVWVVVAVAFALGAIRANIFLLLFLVSFLMGAMLKVTFLSKTIMALGVFPGGEITYILISIGALLVMAPFMWFLLLRLFKRVVNLNMNTFQFRWLFVLPMAYFLIHSITGSRVYTSKGWFGLVALFISNAAVYLSYIAVLQMFLKMHETLVANAKMQLAEQMVILQKEQYQSLADSMEKTARAKHDFRHQLIVIQDFAEQGNIEGLRGYLAEYEAEILPIDMAPVCNMHLVDVVLRHYMMQARAAQVEVEAMALFPPGFTVPEHELCVLFGNLMENALESCQRQQSGKKFLRLKTEGISQNMLVIRISNSYAGPIVEKEEMFMSSKRSGPGMGIATIRYISEKNGGNCKFTYENGVFSARILLID